ncbi:hypothetical protein FRX31_005579 [Thalictrum thalictroides]|uniref:Transmembrane protein n=1 Tax=Thalictrum thalictroides TaxID=46969 RepID=A0A7J6X623_THATH|nr:hypothetical protein FRX31_005579 [Thalictrum thalictroides]
MTTMLVWILVFFFLTFHSLHDVNGIRLDEESTEKLMNNISDLEFDIDYTPPRTHPPGGPPHYKSQSRIADSGFDLDYDPPRTSPPTPVPDADPPHN